MEYKDLEKRKRYQKEWVAQRRKKWMLILGPCSLCGSTQKLHIHHKDPKTKASHHIWSWREDRLLQELVKCVVLCKDCHWKQHRSRSDQHGTITAYKVGCRCQACRQAHSDDNKKWYRRKHPIIHRRRNTVVREWRGKQSRSSSSEGL